MTMFIRSIGTKLLFDNSIFDQFSVFQFSRVVFDFDYLKSQLFTEKKDIQRSIYQKQDHIVKIIHSSVKKFSEKKLEGKFRHFQCRSMVIYSLLQIDYF